MCANSRHRAERRANGTAHRPQALIARVDPPTFDLPSPRGLDGSRSPRHARKVETTYAKYVGRIGALAVSLGVGVAVATTPGVAWAAPDSESDPGASASPGPKTSPDTKTDGSEATKPDTTKPDPQAPSPTAATETQTDGSPAKGDTTPANDRVPTMKVDSSGGALTSAHHTGETASSSVEKSTPAPTDAVSETTSAATTQPVEAASTEPVVPVEPVTPVEPVVEVPVEPVLEVPVEPVVNPHNDSSKPSDGQTAGSEGKPSDPVDHVQSGSADKNGSGTSSAAADDTARHRAASTIDDQTEDSPHAALMSTFAAPQVQVQAPAPFDPVGAILALPGQLFDVASGFVALVITPFLAPTPNAPAQMPLLWTVLAWVRREISHTFFNRSPIANPVQISQTVTGEVSGNLNATDPNGDEPLTYTVTQQPAHGTVVVRPDGTYTYTPTAGAPTSTLTDSFSVTIDDSVGTQLPGVFGVVQGILHRLAQFIGIAQSDTTVAQVAVTVAGTGINLPPLVVTSVINPIPYTVGSAPRVLDANLKVIDGSSNLSGGTVSVGVGFSVGDTLGYQAPANNPIQGSYNAATGVLTLTGTGTVAQYQEALRAVTFSTTAGALIGLRTVSFVVTDDGGLSSISVPLAVTVLAVNLPPVVTTSVVGPIVTAGNPPVTLDANVTIIDGSASLTGGQVTVGVGFSVGDTLGYQAPANNPIQGSYNAATGVLTLTGTGTVAQYQEALRAVTFSTTAGAVVGLRTVSFVVTDIEGLSSISVPLAVTVLALNLPPVVTTSVVGPIVTAGNPPVTLDANVTIIDGSALLSGGQVTVGLGFSAGDTLGYQAPQNNPIQGSYNAATGALTMTGTGTVAQYQEALRAVTFSTTAGAVVGLRTVSFVVTDIEGLSSISVPLAVTVLALNLPPVVTTSVVGPIVTAGNPPVTLDANVTIIDGSASLSGGQVTVGLGFSAGDTLGYQAPANNPIQGSYNAATGVLTMTGTGTVAQYQEALRAVTFSTTAGAVVGLRTVSFVVTDIEGLSSISVPLAVTVLALNLPPVVTTSVVGPIVTAGNPPVTLDANVTIVDGSASLTGGQVTVGVGFSVGDTLGYQAPANNPIQGSYNAATGVLTMTGTGTVAQYQEALRAVTFSTTAGAVVGLRTVSFVVTDIEGLSSISVPLAVTVLALNLPPVVTTSVVGPIVTAGNPPVTLDANVTIVDGSASLTGGQVTVGVGFSVGDTLGYQAPANNPIQGSYNAATGVLTMTGTGTVAQYQEALRAVTFSTTAGAVVGLRTVSFVVTDIEGLSSISVPLAVTVLALNLPPVVTTSVVGPIVTAGNPPVTLDANVTIVDGSASLTGGQVTVGVGFSVGDTLGYQAPANNPIQGSYNAATGVLTMTGTGTVAQYQEALRAVTFSTTAGAVVGLRTVSFVVTDIEGLSSISVPLAVTVLALNLPPVVTTSVVGPIVTAGNPPVTLDANVTIVDGSPTITGATVTITLGHDSADTLGYIAPQNNPVQGSYNSTTGVLTLTGTGTVAQYQEALRAITFSTPAATLASVRTMSFVVTDDGGLSSISVPLAVTVLAINLPPVVVTTILNPIPFTAGNAPVALDPNVTIIDGSASLSGATVAITVGLTAGDSLAFTQPAGSSIVGSYNSATGVLTLTGAGTVTQYQEALRSVTFATTTATLVGLRTVSFVVTDVGGLPSVSVPLVVTVALNLPPIVTSSVVGLSLNVLNGAPPKILDPGVLIVDDSSTLTGATVTVGGVVIGGNDTLSFTSPPGSGISGAWNSSTKTLTLTGAATVADYQTALRSVTFETDGFLNLGVRVVSFVVKDQQGQSSISVPLTVVVVGIL